MSFNPKDTDLDNETLDAANIFPPTETPQDQKPSKALPDFKSLMIQKNIENFFNFFYSVAPNRVVKCYECARSVAEAFKEEEVIKELDSIYSRGIKLKFPISIIEPIVNKEIHPDNKMNISKKYRFGLNAYVELNRLVIEKDDIEYAILRLFQKVCLKYDKQVSKLIDFSGL